MNRLTSAPRTNSPTDAAPRAKVQPEFEPVSNTPPIDPLRARHLKLARRRIRHEGGTSDVIVDDAESPLVWLARRKGRDGRALVEPVQLLAGERLRAEFTRANLMPRVTSNWGAAVATGPRGASPESFTDAIVGARRRVRSAL